METLIIEQKSSNSGSIHDIASDCFDREIKFPKGAKFAVVMASYYGGKGYTTHKTAGAAIDKNHALSEYSKQIIDASGNFHDVCGGELVICND